MKISFLLKNLLKILMIHKVPDMVVILLRSVVILYHWKQIWLIIIMDLMVHAVRHQK